MCDEISFIRRQDGTQKAQIMEFAKLPEWRVNVAAYRQCERGAIAKQAKEDQFLVVDETLDLVSLQHHGLQWIAADKAPVAPYRNKSTVIALNGAGQPSRILTALAASIDERSGEYIVLIHLHYCPDADRRPKGRLSDSHAR